MKEYVKIANLCIQYAAQLWHLLVGVAYTFLPTILYCVHSVFVHIAQDRMLGMDIDWLMLSSQKHFFSCIHWKWCDLCKVRRARLLHDYWSSTHISVITWHHNWSHPAFYLIPWIAGQKSTFTPICWLTTSVFNQWTASLQYYCYLG